MISCTMQILETVRSDDDNDLSILIWTNDQQMRPTMSVHAAQNRTEKPTMCTWYRYWRGNLVYGQY